MEGVEKVEKKGGEKGVEEEGGGGRDRGRR